MYLFNQAKEMENLNNFFAKNNSKLNSFGRTVNQTFEAYVFASCIKWYERNGWTINIINPNKGQYKNKFQLKFNTRGAPAHYSYALCKKDDKTVQIHHGLRVATRYDDMENEYPANICLDVAIIKETFINGLETDMAIPNENLICFGEAKHMSAFAELVAGFIGMVHELLPEMLENNEKIDSNDMYPFLYVSGRLNPTAKGIQETINGRNMSIRIYSFDDPMI
jgi:hypothetical protein